VERARRAIRVSFFFFFFCRKAAKKPLLTSRHKDQLVDFAMNHLDFMDDEWQKVIWMDEKTFSTDKDGRYRV